MTIQVDAIYDGGVLKPLEPLALPDQSQVRIIVCAAEPPDEAEKLAAQKAALAEMRKVIDALPQVNNNDGWSVRQHDELLYGKP
jgi:predicted DNA-binding antitoxin AbrB/MazE fold protein